MQNPPVFPIIIGVTGHRNIPPEASAAVLKSVQDLLEDWKGRFGAALHVMSALAEGADQLVADAARVLNIPIIAVLPMPKATYRTTLRTEESRDNLDRHWDTAALRLELPEIGDLGDLDYRDRQFEQLGVLLIRRSHLLLALWDGTRDMTNRSGATAVVRMRLEGDHEAEAFKSSEMFLEARSYLDVTNRGPILHVVTPGNQATKNPAGTCLLLGLPEPASTRDGNGGSAADAIWTGTAVEPNDLIPAIARRGFEYFDRIDELNRRMADFGLSDTRIYEQQIGYLDVEGIPEQARHLAEVLIRQQAGADTAAQAHQARLLGHFVPARSPRHMLANGVKAWHRTGKLPNFGAAFFFAVMVPLAVLFYETHVVYHKINTGFVALVLYVFCLGGTFYYYWFHVRRQNWQGHFQDYRALAEGMRVQLYWAVAAVPAAVSDHYLRKQSDELGWIQFALRGPALWAAALAGVRKGPNQEIVRRGWIENQAHYFGDKATLHDRAYQRGSWWTKVLVWSGFVVTVALLLVEFCNRFSSSFGGGAGRGLELMQDSEEYVIIVAATLPALAALFSVSGELRAYEPSAHSYSLMSRMFSDAAKQARKPGQSEEKFKELIRELGREALSENAEWLSEHRHREIQQHF
jgi:hypothetical protein